MLDLSPHNTLNSRDEAWRDRGRCRDLVGTMTHLFFSENYYEIERAKAICASCPVSKECLDAAAFHCEPWGVWGGELFFDGAVSRDRRPRGRPPKYPRPLTAVEEVPVPPDLLSA